MLRKYCHISKNTHKKIVGNIWTCLSRFQTSERILVGTPPEMPRKTLREAVGETPEGISAKGFERTFRLSGEALVETPILKTATRNFLRFFKKLHEVLPEKSLQRFLDISIQITGNITNPI